MTSENGDDAAGDAELSSGASRLRCRGRGAAPSARRSSFSGRYGTTPPRRPAPESRMILSVPPKMRSMVSR